MHWQAHQHQFSASALNSCIWSRNYSYFLKIFWNFIRFHPPTLHSVIYFKLADSNTSVGEVFSLVFSQCSWTCYKIPLPAISNASICNIDVLCDCEWRFECVQYRIQCKKYTTMVYGSRPIEDTKKIHLYSNSCNIPNGQNKWKHWNQDVLLEKFNIT